MLNWMRLELPQTSTTQYCIIKLMGNDHIRNFVFISVDVRYNALAKYSITVGTNCTRFWHFGAHHNQVEGMGGNTFFVAFECKGFQVHSVWKRFKNMGMISSSRKPRAAVQQFVEAAGKVLYWI